MTADANPIRKGFRRTQSAYKLQRGTGLSSLGLVSALHLVEQKDDAKYICRRREVRGVSGSFSEFAHSAEPGASRFVICGGVVENWTPN